MSTPIAQDEPRLPPGASDTTATLERISVSAAAATLVTYGLRQRSTSGLWLAALAAPLAYRVVTGHWPLGAGESSRSGEARRRAAQADDGRIHVRDAVRVEMTVAEVFAFWSRLENLPTFMANIEIESVTDLGDGRSHWVARSPGGAATEWTAELVHRVENELLAWRSLPGAQVATDGSVRFEPVRGGRSTQVTVNLHYRPPAGRVGALVATLMGTNPDRTIREDLRRLKQVLEAGEIACAVDAARS
jgi:uncharacterized membrane protein